MHALRNVTKKLPERLHRELKARYWLILDEATSVADARAGLLALVADYRAAYPSAMAVIERDLDALVCHLRFPSEHRKRIRSTNLLERTFVEVRRRTKVIGRFPGETSALSLIWAVLELSSRGWRGVLIDTARRRRDRTAPTKGRRRRRERALDQGGDSGLGLRPSGATPGRFHPDAGTPPDGVCPTRNRVTTGVYARLESSATGPGSVARRTVADRRERAIVSRPGCAATGSIVG